MLRNFVKIGMKSSIRAYDKIKVGLICMKENLEDLSAEVKSEIIAETKTQSSPASTKMATAQNFSAQSEPIHLKTVEQKKKGTSKISEDVSIC